MNIEISDKENVFLVIQANNILPNQLFQINEDLNGKMIYNELNVEVTKFNTPGSGGTPVSISPSSDTRFHLKLMKFPFLRAKLILAILIPSLIILWTLT